MGTLRMRQLGIVCLFCLGLGMPQFQNQERSSGTGEMVPGKLIEDMINIVSQPLWMLNCFQVLDPDYSTSVTLVWMLDCFRFQIQISHFSVDVGLFQVSDPDQSL